MEPERSPPGGSATDWFEGERWRPIRRAPAKLRAEPVSFTRGACEALPFDALIFKRSFTLGAQIGSSKILERQIRGTTPPQLPSSGETSPTNRGSTRDPRARATIHCSGHWRVAFTFSLMRLTGSATARPERPRSALPELWRWPSPRMPTSASSGATLTSAARATGSGWRSGEARLLEVR